MKNLIFFLLVLSFNSFASGSAPLWVLNPDMPDSGWYFDGFEQDRQGAWGVNCELQLANFTDAGTFMFCSLYTHDSNGIPIWYTFSGEYIPNSDVYAWREGRGLMGTLTSPLYYTAGAHCIPCGNTPNGGAVTTQKGTVVMKWLTPIRAEITVNNTTLTVSRMRFHDGLHKGNIDFVTQGWWQVFMQVDSGDSGDGSPTSYSSYNGLVQFEKVDSKQFEGTILYTENSVYYVSSDRPYTEFFSDSYYGSGLYSADQRVVLIYDPDSGHTIINQYTEGYPNLTSGCYGFVTSGVVRPQSSAVSTFYGTDDVRCNGQGVFPVDRKKDWFATLIYAGNSGDAIANNGKFVYEGF
jgi:hypothetical protein